MAEALTVECCHGPVTVRSAWRGALARLLLQTRLACRHSHYPSREDVARRLRATRPNHMLVYGDSVRPWLGLGHGLDCALPAGRPYMATSPPTGLSFLICFGRTSM